MTKNGRGANPDVADGAPAGLSHDDVTFYRDQNAKDTCEASCGHSASLWQDVLFLEHAGERVKARRLRSFAPYEALAALSRPARTIIEASMKVGLAQQVAAEPGSIVAAMINVAVTSERDRWAFDADFVKLIHPEVDPIRPGVAERYAMYDPKRLLRSPAAFLAEARRSLEHLPLLGGDPAASGGCLSTLQDATLLACAVPCRGRTELAHKIATFHAFLELGEGRGYAVAMAALAVKIEAETWGVMFDAAERTRH